MQISDDSGIRGMIGWGALYLLAATVSVELARHGTEFAGFWLPNAVAVVMVLTGRDWVARLMLCAVLNAIVNRGYGSGWDQVGMLALANTFEVLAARFLLLRTDAHRDFQASPAAFLRLMLLGALLPPTVGASLYTVLHGDFHQMLQQWLRWYVGSVVGAAVLLPLLLSLRDPRQRRALPGQRLYFHALLTGVGATLALTHLPFPFVYVGIPLVLAAIRLRFVHMTLLCLEVALIAAVLVRTGRLMPYPGTQAGDLVLFYAPQLATIIPPLLLNIVYHGWRNQVQQLSESEARFRASFEFAAVGMAMVDLRGRFKQVNQSFAQMLGYQPDELLALTFQQITHPDDLEADLALLAELTEGKRSSYTLEKRYLHVKGHTLWATLSVGRVEDVDGRLLYYGAQVQDTSARHLAEMRLMESERFLRSITDALPVGVAYWDRFGTCRFANRAYQHIWRHPDGDIVGLSRAEVLPAELIEQHAWQLERVLLGEAQRFESPVAGGRNGDATSDAPVQQLLVDYVPDQPDGTVSGHFAVLTDISELKRTQDSLQQSNRSLQLRTQEAEDALRTKSEFVASISHEIRTPMNGVLGLVQLQQATDLSPRQADYAAKIHGASLALLSILNEILDFSKLDAGRVQIDACDFSLHQLLRNTLALFAHSAAEKSLTLELELAPDLPDVVNADQTKIGQVLNNLVSNAIKFTRRGSVRLLARSQAHGEGRSMIHIEVVDTGIGIAESHRHKLFEAFSQADNSTTRKFGGTGLGLVISRRYLEMMGGRIDYDSTLGVGSRFHFEVPVAPGQMLARAAIARHDLQRVREQFSGRRVLLVEDNPINRQVAEEMLGQLGLMVDAAENGLVAVRMAAREVYDLILMDLHMPELDGFQATRQIRAAGYPGPIVALTAAVQAEDRERASRAGMDDHLAKPFERQQLIEMLTRHLYVDAASLIEAAPEVANDAGADYFDLDTLRSQVGDNRVVLERLMRLFRDQRQQLDVLDQLIRDHDLEAAARIAHSLKGSAGQFGASALHIAAAEVEATLRRGLPADLGAMQWAYDQALARMPLSQGA